MKKILALTLVLIMALSLATTAFAADADLTNHTYTAYQIFNGTQSETDTNIELGNITWGSGVDGAALLAALKADDKLKDVFADCATPKDVAEAMAGWADKSDNAMAFAKLAYAHKTGNGVACVNGTTALDAGYYLVVDTTTFEEGAENTVYNLALLQLTKKGTFEIANKTDVPESQKKVKDTNDSEANSTTGWQDSADYDIGDDIPFQLKAIIASDYANYTVYKLTFHDKESDGLKFNNDAKVFVDGVEIETGYAVVTTGLDDDCTFEVRFADLKAIDAVQAGSVITVEYTSELDTDAVIGLPGNPNTMHITYSNNPNDVQGGENGKTPDDTVIVFTYKVVVNKVDKDGAALEGAGFTLYKKNNTGAWVEVPDGDADADNEIVGEALTTFAWAGLDDGDYKLEETTTPAGYNTIAPIEFTVTADHDILSDNPTLTSLAGGNLFTGEVDTGALTGAVVNQAGTVLPETGGMGTTIFYIVGGLLAVAAVVLLITKKRMNSAE